MTSGILRDLGAQPLAAILAARGLKSRDLVAASTGPITHKMVARAAKGRRLTENARRKILLALNQATGETFAIGDIFNY